VSTQCRRRHFVVQFSLSLTAQKVVGSKDLLVSGVGTTGANRISSITTFKVDNLCTLKETFNLRLGKRENSSNLHCAVYAVAYNGGHLDALNANVDALQSARLEFAECDGTVQKRLNRSLVTVFAAFIGVMLLGH